jgi:acyl-CoA synthetase (NDP forming)
VARGVKAVDLSLLLHPRTVAVVGASPDPRKTGGRILANLGLGVSSTAVFCVNPNYTEISGIPCFGHVADLPVVPDVVAIAVPPLQAISVVRESCREGVPFLIVTTGGFVEAGNTGAELQEELDKALRGSPTRLVGPNCSGIWNNRDGVFVTLSQDLANAKRVAGPIALISQSGGLGRCFMDRGLAVSYWLGTGNNADLHEGIYVDYLSSCEEVTTIVLIVEGLRDVRSLRLALDHASEAGKSVVAMKVGNSELGQRAARSHTGAMTTDARLVEALFRQHGVIQVKDLESAVDVATLLSAGFARESVSAKLTICGFSGGSATLVADAAGDAGFSLAEFDARTTQRLRAILPPWGATENPVDLTTRVYEDYLLVSRVLEALAEDLGVDILIFPFTSRTGEPDRMIAEQIRDFAVRTGWKRLVAVDISADPQVANWAGILATAGIPCLRGARRVIEAIRLCCVVASSALKDGHVRSKPSSLPGPPRGASTESVAKRWLRDTGLTIPEGRSVAAPGGVAECAQAVGYPLVLKLDVAGIPHKTALGLVETGISNPALLQAAVERIEQARIRVSGDVTTSYLLERQIEDGTDLIVGLERDPVFGYILMIGSGGIFAEVIRDVAFCLLPASPNHVAGLPDLVRAGEVLATVRGKPMSDRAALEDALTAIATLPDLVPQDLSISLEINPLRVLSEGRGVVVLDAKLAVS